MIIAINTGCLKKDKPGECDDYIFEILQRIIKSYTEHTFILFFAEPFEQEFNFPANVITVVTGPKRNTYTQWFIWYNIKIPLLLKKYKADIFVTSDLCSLTTKVPQCLVLSDLSFLYAPSFVKRSYLYFLKKYTPVFLKKSKKVITVSGFSKAGIIENYEVPENKIQVVYAGLPRTYRPVTIEERESVKEKYAGGCEYFIYTGGIHLRNNLMNLLKAFSAFKKRQKSNMQLLITCEADANHDEFVISLRSYKFRNDVKLFTDLPKNENSKITASAYAMVYIPFYEDFGTSLLKAMACEVPAITSSAGVMPEICGNAALYASPDNFKEIAIKMMLLFKDEKLRKDLIANGKQQVQKFKWDTAAEQVWHCIEEL